LKQGKRTVNVELRMTAFLLIQGNLRNKDLA